MYEEQYRTLKSNDTFTFFVDLEHVREYNEQLFNGITRQYYRLMPFIHEAATMFAYEKQDLSQDDEKMDYYVSFFTSPSRTSC